MKICQKKKKKKEETNCSDLLSVDGGKEELVYVKRVAVLKSNRQAHVNNVLSHGRPFHINPFDKCPEEESKKIDRYTVAITVFMLIFC